MPDSLGPGLGILCVLIGAFVTGGLVLWTARREPRGSGEWRLRAAWLLLLPVPAVFVADAVRGDLWLAWTPLFLLPTATVLLIVEMRHRL